jgi:VCBS repeat-containing protein
VLGNDTDPDASDTLAVSAVNGVAADVGQTVTLGSGAKLTLNADGTYSYGPNGSFESLGVGQTATDSFSYTVSDGHGGTSTATVTITVNGANDGPTAADDAGSATEAGTAAGSNASGNVLTNDSDPDAGDSLVVSAVRTGAESGSGTAGTVGSSLTGQYGKLTLNADGTYSYAVDGANAAVNALNASQTLTDTFTYTVSDGHGGTDQATLTVTVHGANDTPVAVNDSNSVGEDGPAVTGSVLGNDNDPDNGDSLTVSAVNGSSAAVGSQVTLSSGALLTLNANGTYSYDPNHAFESLNTGQTATDSFTYTASDGHGGTSTATVTITINGANEAVVADPNDFDDLGSSLATNLGATNGDDVLVGTPNPDNINGGNGADTMYGRAGNDTLTGGNGIDKIYGQAGADTINGSADGDFLYGGSGNDIVNGNANDDTLFGGSGNDNLDGGADNDVITGGYGADTMTGGNGADRFVYLSVTDSPTGAGTQDTITDFQHLTDKIDLTAFGVTFSAVTLTVAGGNTTVGVDTNGDSVADLTFTLQGSTGITSGDFLF